MEITTSFNIGDTVYFLYDNKVQNAPVKECNVHISKWGNTRMLTVNYVFEGNISIPEGKVFASKQDLLDSL